MSPPQPILDLAARFDEQLDWTRQRSQAKTAQEPIVLERELVRPHAQIDRLVYELYCRTEDEIKIVEGPST
jgi:hypothetical protein